ncbi:ABC transporter permease [Terracidiphilus gabretensis]|uniref:ABC transporter permease n=1 Tax=Terracidiphilus gabretensis TaxID=1577687 RepID=UPI00071BCD56|nr:ABC transporter permease [Terracidiphilus gabretensis]
MQHLIRKLSLLFGRHRFRSDLDEEMAFHREQAEQEFVNEGMAPKEAHYAAMRQFGNPTRLRERSEEVVGFRMETIIQDLHFALRQWKKNPGFAFTAILILSLGIASSVAIFAFVDAALIKPLPYTDPNRLVMLFESIPLGPRFHLSYPDYLDWKRENKVFSSLDVYDAGPMMMKTGEGLRQVNGSMISSGFLRTLGVKPMLGRDFFDGEDKPETARTTLLSYSTWQQRYGGNPNVLGQSLVLDGNSSTIIGVLPREFSFAPAEPTEFWSIEKSGNTCRGCHSLFGVARLKDGVTFAAAFADIKTIADNLQKLYPDSNRDQNAFMLPLTERIVGDIRPILLTVLCGAGILLLIASVNVSSLLLVRAESRKREMAVRGALGASPRRLVLQFITEGLLLALIGGAFGLVLAQQGMQLLALLIPKDMLASMPFLSGLGLDTHVLAFAVALIAFSGVLFALTPLVLFRFSAIRDGLSEGGRTAAGLMWRRFGANMVIAELAMAMVLLAGAGLLGKSFYQLLHSNIGMEPDHIATVHLNAPPEKYTKDEQKAALAREVLARVGALPGVKSVGITTKMPIEDADWTSSFYILGRKSNAAPREVAVRYVSAGYMTTLRTRLISGRYFTDDEDNSKPKVVIINRTIAKQYFPGEDPIGKRISFNEDKDAMLIVGVINDIQEGQLDAGPRGATYAPFYQRPFDFFVVLARTSQDDKAMLSSLTSTLHDIDKGMAIYSPMTMDQKIHDAPSTYLRRSSAWLVAGFAIVALVLSVVGLYGVIAYSVSQRTREIGVRMALGAQRGTVYRMVMRQAAVLTTVGLSLGLVCSVGASMLMRKLLFGVRAWDVPTLAGVMVVLAVAALAASFLPARRAASVNPTEALRAE